MTNILSRWPGGLTTWLYWYHVVVVLPHKAFWCRLQRLRGNPDDESPQGDRLGSCGGVLTSC